MNKSNKRFGTGKSPKRFSFNYENIADITGSSVAAVRKHAQRGNFDPGNLLSVLEFVRDKLQKTEMLDVNEPLDLIKKINEASKRS